MRERITRSPLQNHSVHVFAEDHTPPGTYVDYGMYPYAYTGNSEVIHDEEKTAYMAYRKGVRRKRWKNVSHVKWEALVSHEPFVIYETATSHWSANWARVLFGLYATNDLGDLCVGKFLSRVPAPDTGHYDRWQAVKPSMTSRANLFVSLAELRDIKKMWDILPKKHVHAKDWYQMLHWANGLHLNWNFGWEPFISDVYKTFVVTADFERRLSRLLREQDRPLRKRFADHPVDLSEEWTETFSFDPNKWVVWTLKGTIKRASCFDFTYWLPNYGSEEMRWRAWLDALGLHATIGNLWRIVPWAFVADWFVDLGRYLDTFQNDWIAPWVEWHQACYSQKVQGTLTAKVFHRSGTGQIYSGTPVSLHLSQYIRRLGAPTFQAGDATLDADKIRLGASLLFGLLR